ncbi:TPA: hypothetical protein ACGQK4_000028 [Elizabethkingia anophelis]
MKSGLPPIGHSGFVHNDFSYDTIENFVENFILKTNLSIVNGQYIILDIKDECKKIILELDSFEFEYPHLIEIKKYLDSIRVCVNQYLNFYADVNNYYALGILNFKPYIPTNQTIRGKELKFLDLNIKINTVDNNFTSRESTLIKLFRLKNILTSISLSGSYSDMHTALEVKLNFLIYKWYLRASQKEKSTDYDLTLIEQKRTLPLNVFDKWIEKTLNHYEIPGTDWRTYFSKKYNEVPYIPGNTVSFSFLNISNYIKYFKDVNEDDENLKNIIIDIENKISTSSALSLLEKKSYDLLLNYAINNYYSCYCCKVLKRFSLLKNSNDKKIIEKCKQLIDQLIEKHNELILKTKGNTNNFFLDFRVTHTCLSILNAAYEECQDKLLFIETFDDDVNSKITIILDNYKRKKKWSLTNNNYIFKLDHSESILQHNNLDVYYASSFTLAKIDDDVENRFEHVYRLFKDLKLRFTLKYEIETIHSLNEEFKKDNKRIIEVVTLFTAIISFVVGSLGAFDSISNFNEALILLLCFALAISIFVFLMYIANNKLNSTRKYNKHTTITIVSYKNFWFGIKYPAFIINIVSIIIVYCLFLVLLYYLFQSKSSIDKTQVQNKTLQHNIDSIVTKKVDSIIIKTAKPTPQQQGGKTNSKTNGT